MKAFVARLKQFGKLFSFTITAFMQFLIPDIPRELKTQMQREQLLAKEAKYQNGIVKAQEYEDLLTAIRDNGNTKVAKGKIIFCIIFVSFFRESLTLHRYQ